MLGACPELRRADCLPVAAGCFRGRSVPRFSVSISCSFLVDKLDLTMWWVTSVYLTFFYTKRELALRIGYLFVSAAVAGAFGGLLAFGIGHMDGLANYRSWRWAFVIEGLPSVLLGAVVYLYLPDDPRSAKWLSEEERQSMVECRAMDYGCTESAQKLQKADVISAFRDWRVWLLGFAQFGGAIMLYGEFLVPFMAEKLTLSRVLDVFAYYYQGPWVVEARASPASYGALLLCRSRDLYDNCGFIRSTAKARDSVRHLRARMCRWIRRAAFTVTPRCQISRVSAPCPHVAMTNRGRAAASWLRKGFMSWLVCQSRGYVGHPREEGREPVGRVLTHNQLPSNCPRYSKRTTTIAMQIIMANFGGILSPFV